MCMLAFARFCYVDHATGIVATSFPSHKARHRAGAGGRPPATTWRLVRFPSVRECRLRSNLGRSGRKTSHLRRAVRSPHRNREGLHGVSDRFARFLPLAGALAGFLLVGGLALTWGDPSSETAAEEHYSYWRDNRGQHQISGPLARTAGPHSCLSSSEQAYSSLGREGSNSGHGAVAFGGCVLAAGTFALVGMLEGAATNAAHEGSGKPRTRSANFTPTIGWRGTRRSRPCCSRQGSVCCVTECCPRHSDGRRS